ncbi:hypothetical protein DFH06DRAFT_661783 [Mycena polygramma]|nr:hypothetical protein DFH06DRAFT_661783 [Mycena polygramma]
MLACSNCGYAFMATALVPDLPPAIEGITWPDLTLLLTSNDVPLDSEIPPIHAIISDREKQLHAVDDQIFDLEITLVRFVREREQIAESVRQHRAVLSPLRRRVPPELLCEIFVLTLSGDGTAETPPWYLGQICRSWRFSALAYPFLWSSITIPNSRHSMLPLIQTQLRRSANALLTVQWSRNIRESGPIDPHSRDAVLAECSRWSTLRLAVEGSTDDLEWLQPVAGRLTALRKFTLTTCAAPNIPDIFGQASSLREVAVESSGFKYWSPAIVAPWAQVTHFRGVYPAEALLIILAEASNVLQCAVVSLEGDPGPRTPIITACLQRLCINRTARLSHLTAPLLVELFVAYKSGAVELLLFVQRSSCLLKTLVLMECTISSELITVLRDLPSLTYLLIEDLNNATREVADLLQAMTITGTSRDILPNLVSMVVGPGAYFPSDILLSMATSRFQPSPSHSPSPLERLRLFYPPTSAADWSKLKLQIQQMRNEGFDAAILSHSEAKLVTRQGFALHADE